MSEHVAEHKAEQRIKGKGPKDRCTGQKRLRTDSPGPKRLKAGSVGSRLLNVLLDKYESSKTFIGQNKVRQRFAVRVAELFPAYDDPAEYDLFMAVGRTVEELEGSGLVTAKRQKNGVILEVALELSALDTCYRALGRMPKRAVNEQLAVLLQGYAPANEITARYCAAQLERLANNQSVEGFDGDLTSFDLLLRALAAVLDVSRETYARDFSSRVLGDSKALEGIRRRLETILFNYGDFAEREGILEELNIIRNPGHVYFKGAGRITVAGQTIDLSGMDGDIALSSTLLPSVERVEVLGSSVLTIENLTTFNSFNRQGSFIIYLGGYHNAIRRTFIQKVHEQNPCVSFLHYGDIDAGGFYILLHLREKTGIPFRPFRMDVEALKKYADRTRALTANDRRRLQLLLDRQTGLFDEVICYMLEHDQKLEQEAEDE